MTCPVCFLPVASMDDMTETCSCLPGECEVCGYETTAEYEYICKNQDCPAIEPFQHEDPTDYDKNTGEVLGR